jgi:two-component system, LuxR family, sensor kinase FixL
MSAHDQGRELLQLISEGFVFVDTEFRVQEINEVGLRMARRPLSDFLGRELWDIAPHLHELEVKPVLIDAMRERKPVSFEQFYHWSDGRESWLEMRAHPTDGGLAIFYRDISEQKRSQEELKRAQAELMHASRLSAMGTMAATLAHELAQPLTSANNSIEAAVKMLRSVPDQKVREARSALEHASRSVQRGGELLKRLRSFVGKGRVQPEVQDLAATIADAGVLMLPLAQHQGVEIDFKLDPRAQWVSADAIQIQQVLINLIRNAIEAIGEGKERRIRVSTAALSSKEVEMKVEDSGPGLDAATAETLFEPFHTSKAEGLGVGLSICRTIVEAHGGKIEAAQRPEGGAVFRFTLPRASEPD